MNDPAIVASLQRLGQLGEQPRGIGGRPCAPACNRSASDVPS